MTQVARHLHAYPEPVLSRLASLVAGRPLRVSLNGRLDTSAVIVRQGFSLHFHPGQTGPFDVLLLAMIARGLAKRDGGPWDVKNVRGGLTDLEFIQQYHALLHGRAGAGPGGASGGDRGTGKDRDLERMLSSASELFENVLQVSRAATGGVFDPEGSGFALKMRLSQACGEDRLEAAQSLIIRTQCDVKKAYDEIIEGALEPES